MYPAHRELSGLVVGDLVLALGMVGLVTVTGLPCCNRDLQVDMVRLVMGLVMGLVRFHSYLVKHIIIYKCFNISHYWISCSYLYHLRMLTHQLLHYKYNRASVKIQKQACLEQNMYYALWCRCVKIGGKGRPGKLWNFFQTLPFLLFIKLDLAIFEGLNCYITSTASSPAKILNICLKMAGFYHSIILSTWERTSCVSCFCWTPKRSSPHIINPKISKIIFFRHGRTSFT